MSAGIPYIFHQNLVLRTPAFPFITKYNSDIFEYLLNNTAFLAAINIASPVLLEEAIKLKENKITSEKEIVKIRSSLLKYYQRMYSRCTPFGLFSGCSLVNWKKGETNVLLNEACNYSHSRLDMHYLCALIQHISKIPVIKDRLLYSPNSSIYKLSNKLRYIEYNYNKSQRVYQISEVNFTTYLENILKVASPGATIEVLINSLINKQDISRNDAEEFISEMISAQIIVNELEPSITGEEFIHQVLVVLNKINFDDNSIINSINRNLKEIKENMADIETYKEDNYSLYRAIYKSIDKIDVEFEENKLIQTDLFKCPSQNCISIDHQDKLFLAITFLNGLFFQNQNLNLKNFVTRYNDRYEDRKMPLLQVLDSEIGIGYPERRINIKSPLLDQIHLLAGDDKNELNIKWDPTQTWLFNKLKSATEEKKYQINILDEDLKNFPPNWHDMPPSQSVMFRLIDAETIVFENCSGSSASNLLGRFAHGNTKIGELIFDIAQEETNQNPSILFAEILHLPQSRVGNILQHPPFREYEIPFLAKSSLPKKQQIGLNDLFISVFKGKIKLTSKRLGKEIIPRLSTAHNFSNNALPVYQFLCDLQTQNLSSNFSFNWGHMAVHYKFLPRVIYNGVIVFEAVWQFNKTDFIELFTTENRKNNIQEFRKKWKMPQYIVLADADNELLVDLENEMSVEAFLQTIRKRTSIKLKEFLFSENSPVKGNKKDFYINQFIAPLIKTQPVYESSLKENQSNSNKLRKHDFMPGSEWLYYKIYCGIQTAETVLIKAIQPLVSELFLKNQIDKWYFIRYTDTHFHLRVRFHLSDIKYFEQVVSRFSGLIKKLETDGLIWKIQIDTYMPEFERYGHNAIHLAESLFYYDSMQQLEFLKICKGDEMETLTWLWGLKLSDELINSFKYTLEQKLTLLEMMKKAYGKEFKVNKTILKQVNREYSIHKNRISGVLHYNSENNKEWYLMERILQKRRPLISNIANEIYQLGKRKKLSVTINDLLGSYIHMSLNRAFPSDARKHEFILYEFLYIHYNSVFIMQQKELQRKPDILKIA